MITSQDFIFSKGGRYRSLLIAAAILCGASAARAATAQGEWTTSTWSTFTASPYAISRPRYLAESQPYTDFIFCDGYANTSAAGNLGNGRVLAWEFPRKATLTGVDDVNLATLVSPTITTVRQPCAEIAATVLETLFWRFDNPEKEKRRIMLAADLVVRESTTR